MSVLIYKQVLIFCAILGQIFLKTLFRKKFQLDNLPSINYNFSALQYFVAIAEKLGNIYMERKGQNVMVTR